MKAAKKTAKGKAARRPLVSVPEVKPQRVRVMAAKNPDRPTRLELEAEVLRLRSDLRDLRVEYEKTLEGRLEAALSQLQELHDRLC